MISPWFFVFLQWGFTSIVITTRQTTLPVFVGALASTIAAASRSMMDPWILEESKDPSSTLLASLLFWRSLISYLCIAVIILAAASIIYTKFTARRRSDPVVSASGREYDSKKDLEALDDSN